MSNGTTIQLRIDPAVKKEARKILENIGMDLSSAVKLFLTQVIRSRSLPISTLTANGFTPAQERNAIKEARLTKKYGKRYSSAKAAMDAIIGR